MNYRIILTQFLIIFVSKKSIFQVLLPSSYVQAVFAYWINQQ